MLAAAPPDDHVLNLLLLVLKPANRVAELTAAYEAACAKQPGNEALAQGLFTCHARCVCDVVVRARARGFATRSGGVALMS